MTVRNGGFPGDYYRNDFDSLEDDAFGVPRRVMPLAGMSSSERKNLIHRLREELEQIRAFHKNVTLTLTRASKSLGVSRCSTGPGKKVAPVTACTMLRMKQCETLLKRLMSHPDGWLFNTPVDVVKLNIPDYFTIIKHPMDFGTVKSKLTSGTYSSPSEFSADVRLTFSNAMTYNPPGNDVYVMADSLSKFFEVRWKTIQKKSSGTKSEPSNSATHTETIDIPVSAPLAKKRKMDADSFLEPAMRVMVNEDRVKLGRDLGSLTEFPLHIINFLRDHSSKEGEPGDDEIEIDINDLSHDALFHLRDLLDELLQENQKKDSNGEPCELELLHGSGPGNSLMQHCDVSGSEMEDEDVDIGSYEHSRPPLDGATSTSPRTKPSVSGLDQLELEASKEKPSSVDCHQDGNSVQNEKQLPPEKRYRAALLKNRYSDLILKAREKTLNKNEKQDPEKLRLEREELELRKKKEKARLEAEAKEAEEAHRKAEAEAARQAKRKLEVEREAARQALLEMEKSVEINENSRFLNDLELLKTEEQLTSVREGDDDDGMMGVLGFGGSNPLEQLGLFMKHDDEDEDEDEAGTLALPDPCNEVEEGEID
uniref:Transcription factor GTE11 n=1 Tax=Noccaea caerulescens TaxID=107243 RepID=A0A1J3H5I7_NOCCA